MYNNQKNLKKKFLSKPVKHIDITKIDARKLIDSYRHMSFSARDLARAADIFVKALSDKNCSVWLTLAGSTSSAGCMQIYADLVRFNMADAIVATGAAIVDMDFFEGLGFKHYQGTPFVDDSLLHRLRIDRIYDTYINEEELQVCDAAIAKIADSLPARAYSSRQFIIEMGKYLARHGKKRGSLVEEAYKRQVPIFCPAFSDSSAGFGLVYHQVKHPKEHIAIDSVQDFRELTEIKIAAGETGLLMIGGGVPKNFAQDTVVCAEMLGKNAPMHKYAVQITVADVRDGACSSSTLKEASSWGKVQTTFEQMVYAEATTVLPILAAYAYQSGVWKKRKPRRWNTLFAKEK